MPSFDIVSEIDLHELTNAVDQTNREVTTRFDFKGSKATVQQKELELTLIADNEFQVNQMYDILVSKMVKRNIDIACIEAKDIVQGGQEVRQVVIARQGIEQELGKKIIKLIKDSKLKVQATIQGEQVRVTAKQRDDLQITIQLLKKEKLDMPLQYVNFRD